MEKNTLYQERIVRLQQAVALLTMEKKNKESSRFLKGNVYIELRVFFSGAFQIVVVSKTLKGRRERERERERVHRAIRARYITLLSKIT